MTSREQLCKILADDLGYELIKKSDLNYCWLDLSNGNFSNSWSYDEQQTSAEILLQNDSLEHKLIEYRCINNYFTFDYNMRIITKPRKIKGSVEINNNTISGHYYFISTNEIKFFPNEGESFITHYKSLKV